MVMGRDWVLTQVATALLHTIQPLIGWSTGPMRIALALIFVLFLHTGDAEAKPKYWKSGEWSETDFAKRSGDFSEIMSGGLPKDGIPPIDDPSFHSLKEVAKGLHPKEPVIGLTINGKAKAYPLSELIWHEIVNDEIGCVPVSVTYCPLCNAAIVFDRRVDGRVLDFGTTGKLRMSDLIIWDRQTESWWQQFLGEGIVGEMTGVRLKVIPSRFESVERFQRYRPGGVALKPNQPQLRAYGRNPYVSCDSSSWPFLYRGESPKGIEPLARVVAIGEEAWSLNLLRSRGKIKAGAVMLSWEEGQASALDAASIGEGRDIGNVVVQRMWSHEPIDVANDTTFAFAFHGFRPDGKIHVNCDGKKPPEEPLICN
jgi:hypothetical protein